MITSFHRIAGIAIVVMLTLIWTSALVLRLLRREQTPTWLRGLQFWTENLVALQIIVGFGLLIVGRRVVGDGLIWFHYLYGSLFIFIALVGGRIAALRREERDKPPRRAYIGLGWGAFVGWGLVLRALMTGFGW